MNEYQIAAAKRLLRDLEARPDLAKAADVLRRALPKEVIQQISAREREYRAFNRDLKANPAMLSPDAAEYWADAQAMLRLGRLHHSHGRPGKSEKRLSQMCERLEETFTDRVPLAEQGKFLIHDLNGSNWDDRWHLCVDWNPPILRADLAEGPRIENVKARAQYDVLVELLVEDGGETPDCAARLLALAQGRLTVAFSDGDTCSVGLASEQKGLLVEAKLVKPEMAEGGKRLRDLARRLRS